ncbi:MAG: hypothetical protein R3F43_29285 [bacterium]
MLIGGGPGRRPSGEGRIVCFQNGLCGRVARVLGDRCGSSAASWLGASMVEPGLYDRTADGERHSKPPGRRGRSAGRRLADLSGSSARCSGRQPGGARWSKLALNCAVFPPGRSTAAP